MSELIKNGFEFIKGVNDNVLKNSLIEMYDNLEEDKYGKQRHRSYLRLSYENKKVNFLENVDYIQSYLANDVDGDKVRKFPRASDELIESDYIKNIIDDNIKYLLSNNIISNSEKHLFGMHFIRYNIIPGKASYASPVWLHKDDEEIVFVHLVNKTLNLVGGENILARSMNDIINVIELENFRDTIVLTKKHFHAVVPMGTNNNEVATRDIILFTIEDHRL